MATDDEVRRWIGAAARAGYEGDGLGGGEVRRLLDAGLLVAPPAPPPEVTFRAKAYDFWSGNIYISANEIGQATRGKGFRPGATLEVTVRQLD